MRVLTIDLLIKEAKQFCEDESQKNHVALIGVTDGKAVGTYIEHRFQQYLKSNYSVTIGSSARGIDLPDRHIMTDIKTTSVRQPQSSCPYKSASQKIFGLGYNLLVFVYEKRDTHKECTLDFRNCTFIEKSRTGDYLTTRGLRRMLEDGANKDDIMAYLEERNIPGDEIIYNDLAERILYESPKQGYLTISNALQWRLQYSRVISLNNEIDGVVNYER